MLSYTLNLCFFPSEWETSFHSHTKHQGNKVNFSVYFILRTSDRTRTVKHNIIYRVIQSSCTVRKETVGEMILSRVCKYFFFQIRHRFQATTLLRMSLCIIVIVWRGLAVFVKIQTAETELSHSDNSYGNKADKCPPHEQEVRKRSTVKWRLRNGTKGRIHSFHCKYETQLTYYVKTTITIIKATLK
jgi:uncharacterized protein (UPF0333 family)